MDWKEFFKPTKWILLIFVLMILITPFAITYVIHCDPFNCPPGEESYTEWLIGGQIIWDIINALNPIKEAQLIIGYYLLSNWFITMPLLIFDYLIACSIIVLYNKIKK